MGSALQGQSGQDNLLSNQLTDEAPIEVQVGDIITGLEGGEGTRTRNIRY